MNGMVFAWVNGHPLRAISLNMLGRAWQINVKEE